MTRHVRRAIRISILVLALYAGAAFAQAPPTIRDSVGVQIVHNAAASRTLKPTLEARIGVADGAPEYLLYSVYSVAVDAKGTHYVGMDTEIRVFDAAGRYVRTIGRRGSGPGEFGMPPFPIWFSGDSVMAMDRNLMRTTAFSPDGKVLGTFTSYGHKGLVVRPIGTNDSSWVALVEERIDMEDEAAMMRRYSDVNLKPGMIGALEPIELRRYFPGSDSLGRTLFRIPNERIAGISDEPGFVRRPFDDKPAYTVSASGHVFAKTPGTYRIDVFGPHGNRVRSIRRQFQPVPIGDHDFDGLPELLRDAYVINMQVNSGNRDGYLDAMLRSMRTRVDRMKALPRPDYRSPVGRLLASPRGVLWAERSDFHAPAVREAFNTNARLRVPSRWDIFDPSGAYIGTTDLPTGFRPLAVNDQGRVTGVMTSEDAVEFVVTYSVPIRR